MYGINAARPSARAASNAPAIRSAPFNSLDDSRAGMIPSRWESSANAANACSSLTAT